MNIIETIDSTIAILCYLALQIYAFFIEVIKPQFLRRD